jgi:hypothetical protein
LSHFLKWFLVGIPLLLLLVLWVHIHHALLHGLPKAGKLPRLLSKDDAELIVERVAWALHALLVRLKAGAHALFLQHSVPKQHTITHQCNPIINL